MKAGVTDVNWIALRATLIVFPAYLLGLTNPSAYLPIIMKSVSLGQQVSLTDARHAGRELLGSTLVGDVFILRLSLSVAVTLYAWLAVYVFDAWRARRLRPAA